MGRLREWAHHRHRDDFGEGDHQEYVDTSTRDIVLIAGAAALLIGGFVFSLL